MTNGYAMPQLTPHAGHACKCRQPVPETHAQGVAIMSDSVVVSGKLTGLLEPLPNTPAFRTPGGEGWLESLKQALSRFSPLERQSMRGSPINASGVFDPWAAVPIDLLIQRLETPWFPAMMNKKGLLPYMQPIARIADGSIFAYEALARAQVEGRLVSGGEIVDAARAHGAMFQFDQVSRTTAIRTCGPKLLGDEKLFINFIPMVIYDPELCLQSCWKAAQESGTSLTRLVFEVVESEQFPDIEHLKRILKTYQDRGAEVALDDLGTGHTALSYIDELSPDYIKLAKGLIPEAPKADDLKLVRGLVEHAKSRGITVLVEGVETEAQLKAAADLGIDLAQGWLIGKPAADPVRNTCQVRLAA